MLYCGMRYSLGSLPCNTNTELFDDDKLTKRDNKTLATESFASLRLIKTEHHFTILITCKVNEVVTTHLKLLLPATERPASLTDLRMLLITRGETSYTPEEYLVTIISIEWRIGRERKGCSRLSRQHSCYYHHCRH